MVEGSPDGDVASRASQSSSRRSFRPRVYTDPLAPEIDKSQYEGDSGPCFDAFRDGEIYPIDSAEENRMAALLSGRSETRDLSTLSVPIGARKEKLDSFNLYSRCVRGFAEEGSLSSCRIRHGGAIILLNAQAYWDARQLSESLGQAMQSRPVIDQATGL